MIMTIGYFQQAFHAPQRPIEIRTNNRMVMGRKLATWRITISDIYTHARKLAHLNIVRTYTQHTTIINRAILWELISHNVCVCVWAKYRHSSIHNSLHHHYSPHRTGAVLDYHLACFRQCYSIYLIKLHMQMHCIASHTILVHDISHL